MTAVGSVLAIQTNTNEKSIYTIDYTLTNTCFMCY